MLECLGIAFIGYVVFGVGCILGERRGRHLERTELKVAYDAAMADERMRLHALQAWAASKVHEIEVGEMLRAQLVGRN